MFMLAERRPNCQPQHSSHETAQILLLLLQATNCDVFVWNDQFVAHTKMRNKNKNEPYIYILLYHFVFVFWQRQNLSLTSSLNDINKRFCQLNFILEWSCSCCFGFLFMFRRDITVLVDWLDVKQVTCPFMLWILSGLQRLDMTPLKPGKWVPAVKKLEIFVCDVTYTARIISCNLENGGPTGIV